MGDLHIDIETRSTQDLRQVGVYVYAEHSTTDIWCAAYAFGDSEPDIWTLGQPCPLAIVRHVKNKGVIKAYNANFERTLWRHVFKRYGWPVPDDNQFHCVMVRAMAMSLPGDLERCASALGIAEQKDMAGSRLMLQMARPRSLKPPKWWDQEDKLERLYQYCKQDVRVEIEIEKRLLKLSPFEQKVYQLDQLINDRGVTIDARLCLKAREIVNATYKILDDEIYRISNGQIGACTNTGEIVQFLKRNGVDTDSIAKPIMEELLAEELSPLCRRVIELRAESAKTSVAKVSAMLTRMSSDGRMRGNLQYHGAGTGRWAARGAQLQNLKRPSKEYNHVREDMIEAIMTKNAKYIELMYGPPLTVVSECIRPMITAPAGFDILAGDYANIEGRVNAFLAGQEDKVTAFARGEKIYEKMAAKIYKTTPDKIGKDSPERQLGKAVELGAGFGMGWKKFIKTCKKDGLEINEDTAKAAITTWREVNDRIVSFWEGTNMAAINAILERGKRFSFGYITYRVNGSFLWCQLPSGRCLCYPYPKLKDKETPWSLEARLDWFNLLAEKYVLKKLPDTAGPKKLKEAIEGLPALSKEDPVMPEPEYRRNICFKGIDSTTKQWTDQFSYGGSLVENIVQATARDIMAEAMIRLEENGYKNILTVHDEIVTEIEEGFGSVSEFTELMAINPTWAQGCPIAVETWRGKRYRK